MATRRSRAVYDNPVYRAARRRLKAQMDAGEPCHKCGAPASTVDHVPPLSTFPDPREWVGDLLAACARCNFGHGLNRKSRRGGRVTYRR